MAATDSGLMSAMKFSEEMILSFKKATMDTNDIHPPYALGFQIDAVAAMAAKGLMKGSSLVYAGQEMRFELPLRQDEEFYIAMQQETRAVQTGLYKNGKRAAYGNVCFSMPCELKEEDAEASGIEYSVEKEDVALFHSGIGSEDYAIEPLFLAALASDRTIRHFKSNGITIPADKMAVFAKHKIDIFRPATEICYGDTFLLDVTSCIPPDYSPSRPLFRVGLSAATKDRRLLYTVNLALIVDERKKLNMP